MAAIYQWIVDDDVYITSTPYPIVDIEYADISVAFFTGDMGPLPTEIYTFEDISLESGLLAKILFDTGPTEEDYEVENIQLVSGSLISALISLDPEDEIYTFETIVMLDGSMEKKLIVVESPDEQIDIAAAPIASDCSMTPV
jgi:hypothetical protein